MAPTRDLLTALTPLLAYLTKGFEYAGGSLSVDTIYETLNGLTNSLGDEFTASDEQANKEIREIQTRTAKIKLSDDAILNIGELRHEGEVNVWLHRRQPDGKMGTPRPDQNKFLNGETRILLIELKARRDEVVKCLEDLAERKKQSGVFADEEAFRAPAPDPPQAAGAGATPDGEVDDSPGFEDYPMDSIPPFCSGANLLRNMNRNVEDIAAEDVKSSDAVTCKHCYLDIQRKWDSPERTSMTKPELMALAKYHVAARNPKHGYNAMYRCSYCPEGASNRIFSSPWKFSGHMHTHVLEQRHFREVQAQPV